MVLVTMTRRGAVIGAMLLVVGARGEDNKQHILGRFDG